MCAFLHSDKSKTPNKISKKRIRNPTKRLLQFYAVHRKLGCVSQDIELPEQTVGPTNARGSILKNNEKRSPRAHLDLKYTKTAERLTNIGEQVGPCLEVVQGGTHIIPAPTLLRLLTEIQIKRCGMHEKQLGNGPSSCAEFTEPGDRSLILHELLSKQGTGPRPMHVGPQGKSEMSVQRAVIIVIVCHGERQSE